jgi:hypothetical protein
LVRCVWFCRNPCGIFLFVLGTSTGNSNTRLFRRCSEQTRSLPVGVGENADALTENKTTFCIADRLFYPFVELKWIGCFTPLHFIVFWYVVVIVVYHHTITSLHNCVITSLHTTPSHRWTVGSLHRWHRDIVSVPMHITQITELPEITEVLYVHRW